MPTMNRIDMLNCAAGHHDFSDDASECHVCGLPDLDASMPAPTDPVRDAAPNMLAALKALLQIVEDARADEDFNATTCDAGGVIFGDVATEAIEASRAAIAKAEGPAKTEGAA